LHTGYSAGVTDFGPSAAVKIFGMRRMAGRKAIRISRRSVERLTVERGDVLF